MIDWDDAFDNMGYTKDSDALPAQWAAQALTLRNKLSLEARAKLDLPYGAGEREAYDQFIPRNADSKGTMIFVHGGYWMRLDKSHWSHCAQGCLENDWSVAIPSYPLAPHARIAEIGHHIMKAVSHIASSTTGPLVLVGHSAGGQLVSRMACKGVLPEAISARLKRVISISGVHHLNPLIQTKMNDMLGITEAEANAESPVHLKHNGKTPITFFVGDHERPEFLRQTRMAAERWAALGAPVSTVYHPGTDHFSVLESLLYSDGALTQEITGT